MTKPERVGLAAICGLLLLAAGLLGYSEN